MSVRKSLSLSPDLALRLERVMVGLARVRPHADIREASVLREALSAGLRELEKQIKEQDHEKGA